MLKAGRRQELVVVKKVSFGVYLAESEEKKNDRVLLPKKQVPAGCDIGTRLSVFLYLDSDDRLISTVNEPYVTLHELAVLKVMAVGKIGAFLDWGLEKDLFLPFKEQTYKVSAGDEVLIALYTDKSGRLCATMRVYDYLKLDPPYSMGDMLPARVCGVNPKFGVFIAVEDRYNGLIPQKDVRGSFVPGDKIMVRIAEIREDGKLVANPNEKAYLKIEPDAEKIKSRIEALGGCLPFDDHADPSVIDAEFSMSKAAFKRAVGHLLKERKIKIEGGKILLSSRPTATARRP